MARTLERAINTPFMDSAANINIAINGGMEVSQESGTTQLTLSLSLVKNAVDMWGVIYNQAANTAVFKCQQVAPPGAPAFGLGFPSCLQLTATTLTAQAGAGDFAFFQGAIEGYRTAKLGFGSAVNPQFVTIGFWVYATIVGTATVAIRNSVALRSYVSNITVNNALTWEYKTVTVPVDTTGAWGITNATGIVVSFCFGAGATFQGTNNAWQAGNFLATSSTTNFFASNNNTVCITGVGIWPGTDAPSAARSPFAQRPYTEELLLCMRYYRKSFPQGVNPAQNAGVTGAITVKNPIALGDPSTMVYFTPVMRATPTIVTYNPSAANANWRDITAAADATVSVNPSSTMGDASVLLATSGTVATLGDILAIHYTADARL